MPQFEKRDFDEMLHLQMSRMDEGVGGEGRICEVDGGEKCFSSEGGVRRGEETSVFCMVLMYVESVSRLISRLVG